MSLTLPMLQILLALIDEDRHGYGILLEIERRTGGPRLGTGLLYTTIKRLLERGLIEETAGPRDAATDDRRRRYYRLTDAGRRAAVAEASRLERVLGMAREKEVLS